MRTTSRGVSVVGDELQNLDVIAVRSTTSFPPTDDERTKIRSVRISVPRAPLIHRRVRESRGGAMTGYRRWHGARH
jgi:hypothetical protein